MADDAMESARKLSQPYTLATVAVLCAWVSQLCGDLDRTMERAETAISLSNVEGFPFWAPMGVIMRGWVLLERGELELGLAEMRRGLSEFRQVGASVTVPYHLTLLAQALAKVNQHQEASDVLAEAEKIAEQNEESWWNAEIARLKGEFALASVNGGANPEPGYKEAERYFRQALSIALEQGAKSVELRAAASLCCLERARGKNEGSRRDLLALYESFKEGFGTRDLVDAKAVLS
jgi:predicted ATPase